MVTDAGCHFLASALQVNPSHLRELVLNSNFITESGIIMLIDLQSDPNCILNVLELFCL